MTSVLDALSRLWRGLPGWARVIAALAFIAFCFILPLLKIPVLNTPQSDFPSVLFYPVGTFVLIAIGLDIVVGRAGLLDLGYVAFFAVGGYTVALIGTKLHWTFFAILPVAIIISMLAGVLLGGPTLRLRGDYLAIVTLGFGEIIRITARNTKRLGADQGISSIPHPPDIHLLGLHLHFGILDPKPYYWVLLTFIIVIIVMVLRLEKSRVGRAWTAIREDEDAAELMGVPTYKFKVWAFALGAGVAGMAGTLFASKVTFINPENYPFELSILFLAAVVLGGSGNIPGAILGGIVVAYLPERFRFLNQYRILIFGATLVVMMIFRPQGLLPARRRAAELADRDMPGGSAGGSLGAEVVSGGDDA